MLDYALHFIPLAFAALLPIVNPIGSALIFLSIVGPEPPALYRKLALRIAINMLIFIAVIELLGAWILKFFGISLPILQVGGGVTLAAMGWRMLNAPDAATPDAAAIDGDTPGRHRQDLLSAYDSAHRGGRHDRGAAGAQCQRLQPWMSGHRAGTRFHFCSIRAAGAAGLSELRLRTHARGQDSLTRIQGVHQLISFILLCIGVQIALGAAWIRCCDRCRTEAEASRRRNHTMKNGASNATFHRGKRLCVY